ncbi:TetR family transcriptional regulator [Nocardia sp. NPDC051030]|uniref:acyl-CoA-like ligand-binding transcription factor n=1 Tax=Nocardia sp. NPDC051030 TaxID=3155162 RepID=UPI00341C8161
MPAESNPALLTDEPARPPRPTLRERKKERTRRAIRTEAFRLFREQGYNETTVEQIAEAADVSPSTFFRYFPSKDQVVLADDLDPVMIRAIERQPKDMTVLQAIRQATIESFAELSSYDFGFETERTELLYSVPELRGAVARELERNIDLMAAIAAKRLGRDADDFECRVLAGALTGAMLSQINEGPYDPDRILKVIDFVASGMKI